MMQDMSGVEGWGLEEGGSGADFLEAKKFSIPAREPEIYTRK